MERQAMAGKNHNMPEEIEDLGPVGEREKRDWRLPDLPLGQRIVDDLDPHAELLTKEQRQKILAVTSHEDMMRLLYAELGDGVNIDIPTATKYFGPLLESKLEIPKMLFAWRFSCLAQTLNAVDEGVRLSNDKSLTGQERIQAYGAMVEACKAQGQMVDRLQRLARAVGALEFAKKSRKKVKIFAKPLRAAPSLT